VSDRQAVENGVEAGQAMSKSTLPRLSGRISNYCWAEHTGTHVHCTEPVGHSGRHWHPYSKTSW
jgi:hypothetical protein